MEHRRYGSLLLLIPAFFIAFASIASAAAPSTEEIDLSVLRQQIFGPADTLTPGDLNSLIPVEPVPAAPQYVYCCKPGCTCSKTLYANCQQSGYLTQDDCWRFCAYCPPA